MKEEELQALVASIFGVASSVVKDDLERDAIDEWDSFNHLMLITEIEKEIGTKLTSEEIESIKTIKDLKDLVASKV